MAKGLFAPPKVILGTAALTMFVSLFVGGASSALAADRMVLAENFTRSG